MAAKTVVAEARMGEKFKAESKLGNHTIYIDQPAAMGGTDAGPNPLELFLLSLAGCISAIGRIVAMQKKITLRGMTVRVEGTLNADVLMGMNTEDRAGFPTIEVEVDVDADLSLEEKQAFVKEIDHRCPVSENITNTSTVSVRLKA